MCVWPQNGFIPVTIHSVARKTEKQHVSRPQNGRDGLNRHSVALIVPRCPDSAENKQRNFVGIKYLCIFATLKAC